MADGGHLQIFPGCYCIFNENMPSNGLHFHNHYELCLVVEGTGEYIHGKTRLKLQKEDLFLADPGVLHEIRFAKNASGQTENQLVLMYFSLYLTDSKQGESGKIPDFLAHHDILRSGQKHLLLYLTFIEQYHALRSQPDFGISQAVKNLILDSLEALTVTNDSNPPANKPVNPELNTVLQYIENHLDQKITLKEAAAHIHISKRKLQYLFRQHLKTTFTEYINRKKILLACSYLRMNYNVNEAGSLVGIPDPAQFSRLFKKEMGISPKKYASSDLFPGITQDP